MAAQRRPSAVAAAASPALLCAGLTLAVALRAGIAAGPDTLAAATAFSVALVALAVAAGWRPGRPSLRSALIGAGGAALLLAGPFLAHMRALPLQAGSPPGDLAAWAIVVTLVACAEEALLRGALMDELMRRGRVRPEVAAVVAALAFAALHVPLYGWGAVPLDFGVGVWLGGLRLWSGGAGAPALAHTLADVASWWLR